MAETQLCGLCTNVGTEMTFEADLLDPNEPQIYILRLKKVLPKHICTICEEQTQAQQNYATQTKENPKFSEAQPLPTEELASYEINLFSEEQENNDVEDRGALRARSPLSLLADISFNDKALSVGDTFDTADFYDWANSYNLLDVDQRNSMVCEEKPTEADGMKLEEMNGASLPSNSEVIPPKKEKSNILKREKNRQRKSIDRNCELCGKHFTLRNSLWRHMQQHKNGKMYKCDICPASFVLNANLKQHKLRHTWEFGCSHCDRRFKQKNCLTNHERIHTEERPYVCPTCGKGFLSLGNLKAHMVIHTGVRAHRCKKCDVAFKIRSDLLKHYLSKKHKENVEKPPINMIS